MHRADPTWLGRRPWMTGLILVGFVLTCRLLFASAPSSDLLSLWMGGQAFASHGALAIYPPVDGLFDMRPPAEWADWLRARDHAAIVFPFIYPPLVAAIAAGLGSIADFDTWRIIASLLNPLILGFCVLAARRIAAPAMAPEAALAIALPFFVLTAPGFVALNENQPQILIAFLTVLAIERAAFGHAKTAGLALALAAAIKIYPGILVVFWLAQRRFPAAQAFFVWGISLAALSLLVGGMPLHLDFLAVLSSITGSVLITVLSWSLDAGLANLFMQADLQGVAGVQSGDATSTFRWFILAKTPLWQVLSVLMTLAVLAGFCRAFARASTAKNSAMLWPAAMICLTLVGPVAWTYYYLAPLAFVAPLAYRLGPVRGATVLIGLAAGLSLPGAALNNFVTAVPIPWILAALVSLAGFAFLFVRERRAPGGAS